MDQTTNPPLKSFLFRIDEKFILNFLISVAISISIGFHLLRMSYRSLSIQSVFFFVSWLCIFTVFQIVFARFNFLDQFKKSRLSIGITAAIFGVIIWFILPIPHSFAESLEQLPLSPVMAYSWLLWDILIPFSDIVVSIFLITAFVFYISQFPWFNDFSEKYQKVDIKIEGFIQSLQNKLSLKGKFILSIILGTVPILLASLIFFIHGSRISPDSLWYMVLGENLYQGHGYVDVSWQPVFYRGPGFALLIAFFYRLFGVSAESALWAIRIFFVLSVLVIYGLGDRLFNKWVAIFATVLVVTSFSMLTIFDQVLSDPVMVFFMLLSVLLLLDAFKKDNFGFYFLSGLSLGFGYLVKSSAAALLPMAGLTWLFCSSYRNFKTFRKMIWFYIGAAIFIVPWLFYSLSLAKGSAGTGGDVNVAMFSLLDPIRSSLSQISKESSQGLPLFSIIFEQIRSFFHSLYIYYARDFQNLFPLAPLFFVGLIYQLYRFVRYRRLEDSVLVFGFLLYALLIPIQIREDFGPRHNLFHYFLYLLFIASSLWSISQTSFIKKSPKIIIGFLPILILAVNFFIGESQFLRFFNPEELYRLTSQPTKVEFFGYLNSSQSQFQSWLAANIKPSDRILSDVHRGKLIAFFLNGKQPVDILNFNYSREVKIDKSQQISRTPLLYLWTYVGTIDTESGMAFLGAVSEPELIEKIQKEHIHYVILSDRSLFMSSYFSMHPAFSEVANFDEAKIRVYHVDKVPQPINSYPGLSFETQLGVNTSKFLNKLREKQPGKYAELSNNYLKTYLGLSDLIIDSYLKGQTSCFNSSPNDSAECNLKIPTNN